VDTKANQSDLAATNATVATKANQTDLATTNTTVATKANQTDLTTLITTVGTKANQSDMTTVQGNITTINSALTTKADLVSGVLKSTQIPTGIPQANVTSLVSTLAAKADLSGGVLATGQIPTNIPQSSVTGLGTALGNKADLVAGVVPLSQIPLQAQTIAVQVSSQAAMLALTSAQVQVGDFCIITTGVNQGTYILTGSDPSNLANWAQLPGGGGGTVTTVNGYSGPTVTLSASDVGALGASASIPQSQITGLTTALATFATSAALTSGLAGKTSSADVQGMLTNSSFTKRADYVATSAIASLSGLQSVDGVLIPVGALVLATAQASSVNNGLYTASVGAWARPADFATNSYLARDTVVFVQNQTAGVNGTANNATIWQMQVASGLIDTNVNNWTRIGYIATPFTPAAGNGITITGSTFSANVASGGGILAPSGGIQRDPNLIPGKFLGTVPGGSTVAGITHNLNTTSPIVSIWDTASNALVLAGVTVTSANAISIEFASAPTTGQYRICDASGDRITMPQRILRHADRDAIFHEPPVVPGGGLRSAGQVIPFPQRPHHTEAPSRNLPSTTGPSTGWVTPSTGSKKTSSATSTPRWTPRAITSSRGCRIYPPPGSRRPPPMGPRCTRTPPTERSGWSNPLLVVHRFWPTVMWPPMPSSSTRG
jgi:hypothetical protein